MENRLQTTICGIPFQNPIITASGTFGYGLEYARYVDLDRIGGITVKGISSKENSGNPMPRVTETHAGMLNAIGLQNIGVERFVREKLPALREYKTNIIVNFWGKSVEEYVMVAHSLDNIDVDLLEMNISCPNIKKGGIAFGTNPDMTFKVVNAVRNVVKNKPLIVKLSPNVTDIRKFGKAVEEAGADAISAINTLLGMSIDIETHRSNLANITGGLSGPAIKPVAVRMVYQLSQTVRIPIIGIGGIMSYRDVIEFYLAGASAVQIGTANFVNPAISVEIIDNLSQYLKNKNINNISELTGELIT